MTLYAVAIVEYGHRNICSPKAKVLHVAETEEEAKEFVHEDMMNWADYYARNDITTMSDFSKHTAWLKDCPSERCEWSITKVMADI